MTEVKKQKHTVPVFILFVISMILATVFAMDMSGFFGVPALILSCVLLALVFLFSGNILYVLPALLPAFIVFMLKGMAALSVMSLIYIPAGFMLTYSYVKKYKRTQIITRVAIIIIAASLLSIFTAQLQEEKKISLERFKESCTDSIHDIINIYDDFLYRYYYNTGLQNQTTEAKTDTNQGYMPVRSQDYFSGEDEKFLSSQDKNNLLLNYLAVLPSFFIISSLAFAYIITALFRIIYNIFITILKENNRKKLIQKSEWSLQMSPVSLLVLIVCLIAQLFISTERTLIPLIVVMNLLYIFIPGYFIVGFSAMKNKMFQLFKGRIFPFVIFVILFSFLFSFLSQYIIIFIMLTGVIKTFKIYYNNYKAKIKDKIKNIFFDDDDE